jgi:hypothetical protein
MMTAPSTAAPPARASGSQRPWQSDSDFRAPSTSHRPAGHLENAGPPASWRAFNLGPGPGRAQRHAPAPTLSIVTKP